nr:hypothetical protein [Tanacetum cinerariifolium]
MHVYWASVFMLPSRVLLDIEQIMRGFLWSQDNMSRGKVKVAWDKLLSLKESLWVKWIHIYKLKNRSFWDIPYRGKMSWSWRKLLLLRPLIREFIWSCIGDGRTTFMWFDKWCVTGPLSNIISSHDIIRAGFSHASKVRDCIQDGLWIWPNDWLVKYPILNSIPTPVISDDKSDSLEWRCRDSMGKPFSVHNVMDSHEHLFFEYSYSSKVWCFVRDLAGMESIQPRLEDIVSWLSPMATKRSFKSVVGKLSFAATTYVIWCERNNWLFKNTRRSLEELKDQIMVVVRLKLTTFRFKNKMVVNSMLAKWKLPNNFRLYGS